MIQIEHVYKSFSGRIVLQDVSLEISDGITQAIIGQSGSGKSVLMKHLIGLLRPDRGRILVDQVDIGQIAYTELREVRQQFGVLFQGGALFDSMSAFDNVAFPLRTFTSKTDQEIQLEVQKCLDLVQLSNIGSKNPEELSGGMRKRVALARAIALRPRYILYDEPTSGLDPETSNAINHLIKGLADRLDITSVVITHDMHSVLTIADHVAFIHNSRMHWNGTVDQLQKSNDETLRSFIKANEYRIGSPSSSKDNS